MSDQKHHDFAAFIEHLSAILRVNERIESHNDSLDVSVEELKAEKQRLVDQAMASFSQFLNSQGD
jgi:hypothetical protein